MTNYEERLIIPITKSDMFLFTINGNEPICSGYERIVIGGRGPYIEFIENQLGLNMFHIPSCEEYRLRSDKVYYIEYRSIIDNVKMYYQKKPVDYADYIPERYYISPFDLYVKSNELLTDKKACITPLRKNYINKK